MSDMQILLGSIKETLQHVADQALGLGKGLEDAAPGKADMPNKSVAYLYDIADRLHEIVKQCDQLQKIEPESKNRPEIK